MRAGEQLEQVVDEVLKAGDGGLRVMHGYGSQAHQVHATDATHHTHPTPRMEGAGRATWAFDEQMYGGKLAENQNPGAMEWMLLPTPKKLDRV